MARYETLMQLGQNAWKGCRLLVIDEVPQQIPQTFLPEVLSRCRQRFLTLELCVFSAEDQHRLTAALVLRYQGENRHVVNGVLEETTHAVIAQCQALGFAVRLAGEEETAILSLWNGTASAVGFFPEEQQLGPMRFYAPGHYSQHTCLPIDWSKLTELLSRYPCSAMCVQVCNTQLFPGEIRCIQENKRYFAALGSDANARKAGSVFDRLYDLISRPLLYVNLFALGTVPFLEDVAAQMQLWRYDRYVLPRGTLLNPHYLFTGDEAVTRISRVLGHSAHCPEKFARSQRMQRLTHLTDLHEVAALLPLPARTASLTGLRVKRALVKPVQIPESRVYREGKRMLFLGEQTGTGTPLGIPLEELLRHGIIVGKSGSGKTTFALGMLYQLHQQGIPFLAIEPTKRDYRHLLHRIPELRIYTPGSSDTAPMALNPFLPPRGVTLQEYLPALTTIFEAVISMDHPLDVIFPQVIRECYTRYGWRLTSTRDSQGAKPFGMNEFIQSFQQFIRARYADSPEARGNLESGGVVRLTQLISEQPILFDTVNAVDFDELLYYPAIIELDTIDNPQQKSLVMMTILVQVMQCIRRQTVMDSDLQRVIMIDEAHLLLGDKAGTNGAGVRAASACAEFLQNMVKVLRSYGTGLFFGDQSAVSLTQDVIEQVNVKIMFRQDSPRERGILSELTRMDAAMQEDMIDLPRGCAYVFLDKGLDKPARQQFPDYKKTLGLCSPVTREDILRQMGTGVPAPFTQCAACAECAGTCDIALRMDAFFITSRLMTDAGLPGVLAQENPEAALAEVFARKVPAEVEAAIREQALPWRSKAKLSACTAIQLIRALRQTGDCPLSDDALLALLHPAARDSQPPVSQPERELKASASTDMAVFTAVLQEEGRKS